MDFEFRRGLRVPAVGVTAQVRVGSFGFWVYLDCLVLLYKTTFGTVSLVSSRASRGLGFRVWGLIRV